MQRLVLFALASVGVLACRDASSPTAADPPPNFAKSDLGITVTSIGPAKGGSEAEDVNDAGLVVGNLYVTPSRAFLWTPAQPRGTTGTLQDLGTLGGPGAQAKAVNNSGHVVGGTGDAAGVGRAFLWTRAGGMQDLGLAPGWTGAMAVDLNESGQVAGFASTDVGQRAALWTVSVDAGGAVQVLSRESLGTLPDGGSSVAFGMNNLAQVVGYAYYPVWGPNRAVLWTRTPTGWMIEDLGVLPGDYGSTAYGVNDQGQVVGVSMPQQGCFHAVLWTTQSGKLTGMRALETPGGCPAEAWAINNQAQVVGRLRNNGRDEAALWTLAADGSTASIKNLGRLSGTASSLAIGLSASVGGLTEVVGLSRATSEERATLWTVK